MRSRLIIGSIVAFLLLLAGACALPERSDTGNSPGDGEEQADGQASTLSGSIVFATNRTDKTDTTIRELVQQFTRMHPAASIQIVGIKDNKTLITMAASNEVPDVGMTIPNVSLDIYPKYYLPLDDLGFSEDEIQYYEWYRHADGYIYAIPPGVAYNGIVYNKRAFERAGIEAIPESIEQLYDAAARLKQTGIIPLATSYTAGWPLGNYTDMLPFELSGDAQLREKWSNSASLYNEKQYTLQPLRLLSEFRRLGYLEPDVMAADWENQKRLHAQGDIAMAYLGSWYVMQLVDYGANLEDIGMFPFPEAKALTGGADGSLSVSRSTAYPELAKAFLRFLIEDGRYARAVSTGPSAHGEEHPPYIRELLDSGLSIVYPDLPSTKLTQRLDRSGIDLQGNLLKLIVSDEPELLIEEWNRRWGEAAPR